MDKVKLARESSSADLEAAEEFLKYLQSVIQEKGYVEEQVFNADETGLFYKDFGQRTYNANGLKSPCF